MPEIVPTTAGQDLVAPYKTGMPLKGYDAHVRLEVDPEGVTVVCADVFDSAELDNNKAHVESECASWGNGGARRITEFLRGYGFDTTVRFA
ncbi:MAG: hypothetical protein IVW52_04835 [Acidimicrobiales bacterium]|nr:hypothetical protein [Acidimicrobiales bacterium]